MNCEKCNVKCVELEFPVWRYTWSRVPDGHSGHIGWKCPECGNVYLDGQPINKAQDFE